MFGEFTRQLLFVVILLVVVGCGFKALRLLLVQIVDLQIQNCGQLLFCCCFFRFVLMRMNVLLIVVDFHVYYVGDWVV